MSNDLQSLMQAIREACSPRTWSRGVELARAGAVVGEEDEGDEIALRVSTKGGLVSPQVVLFPEDDDWTCECNAKEDACAHVAAAVIALQQARKAGKSMPGDGGGGGAGTKTPGHIGYRLDGRSGKLQLFRVIVTDEGENRLDGSLASIALGKAKGPRFVASEADLEFEKKLGTFAGGVIPRPVMKKVLSALKGVRDITLDGEPIEVGSSTSGMAVRVTQSGDGFLIRLEQDKEINEIYDNGAVRKGRVVSAVGQHGLAAGEFDDLRKGKVYGAKEVGTLVGDVLPRLRRHVSVLIDAPELPGSKTIKPRLVLGTDREGTHLSLLPTIVYGDPPVARLDGDRLTMLREGEVPLRNPRLEKLLLEELRSLGMSPGTKMVLPPQEAIEVSNRLRRESEVALEGKGHEDFFAVGNLTPHLDVGEDGSFSVWFEVPDEESRGSGKGSGTKKVRADASAVLEAWERGESYAPILEGGFGKIPDSWLASHGHRVAALLSAREALSEGRKEAATWALADLAALCETLEQPPPPGFDRLRVLVEDFEGIEPPRLPDDLTATLRDYQHQGVAWLSFLRKAELGGLLADDMGLGKTLQTLCVVEGRTLVVAPTSVLYNWAAEVEKFRPALKVCVYHGPSRSLDPEADITLTTYALLRIDQDKLIEQTWDTMVLDEAQAIKNPDSQVARAAYRLDAKFRIALTGTPVENRLDDLWSQFHFLNRGLLGGRSEFLDLYANPIASGSESSAAALRERIKPFVLRRLKREVAKELPPRTDVVLRCELDREERRTYDAVRAATQEQVVAKLGGGADVMAVLEALLRLRQAACHRALLPGQAEASRELSSKIALLLETLDEVVAEGHKALVFSQWTSLLDLVEPHLKRSNLEFVRLDGSTRDRQGVVDAFQSESGPPVMLISLRAGGTGLNLTAADNVFLLDPWWNPAVEDQAADRAHRIGQDKPVIVHRLVARDTVEERILALQESKRRLAETAVGDAKEATSITKAELLALLD